MNDFLTLIKSLPEEIKQCHSAHSKDINSDLNEITDLFKDKLSINQTLVGSVKSRLIYSKIEYPEYIYCDGDDRYDEVILDFNCYAFYDHGILKGSLLCDVDQECLLVLVDGNLMHNPNYPFFTERNVAILTEFLKNN
jgi:hypothetical protein